MSIGMVGKLWRYLSVSAFLWLALPSGSWAQSCATCPSPGYSCGAPCQTHHCPPHFVHCQEGPPRLCFRCGCPHPVCNPCTLPHWGYWETCWAPTPFPSSWLHCPTPPPAAFVHLDPLANRNQGMPVLQAPNPVLPGGPHVLPPVKQVPEVNDNGVNEFPPPRKLETTQPRY